MSLPQYGKKSGWGHVIAIPTSILFHVGLAFLLISAPAEEKKEEVWIEMELIEKSLSLPQKKNLSLSRKPEPPKPEPPNQSRNQRVISGYTPEEEPPPKPPPEKKKKVRRVQGLKAPPSQKAEAGLSARAGTTLQTSASKKPCRLKKRQNRQPFRTLRQQSNHY